MNQPAGKSPPIWIYLAAFAVPMVFALFTNHVWEDYYITFRASKNLAEGHGLVFQIGERLHTFTSPLGVLLPALLNWLTKSDTATLWLFRVASCGALAGASVALWQTLKTGGAGQTASWVTLGLLLSCSTTVDFTINGMETAFLLFFTLLTFRELARPAGASAFTLGGALAGMMWSRPDAFVPGGAILAGTLFFMRPGHGWREMAFWTTLCKALFWAALFYGPWLAWAWWYYGSPVPHTIVAKSGLAPAIHLPAYLLQAPLQFAAGQSTMTWMFMPAYYAFGGWPESLVLVGTVLAVVSGFIWLFSSVAPVGRAASFAVFIGSFYLQAIPIFPWYVCVWQAFAAVALGCGAAAWLRSLPPAGICHRVARCIILVVLVVQVTVLGLNAWQVKQQQAIVEDQGRQPIGEWFAAHAAPTDTVTLECLGYIGYFSQLHMLDYPGLTSREVVETRHRHGDGFTGIIARLKPTWLVLRPVEYQLCKNAGVMEDYRLLMVSDVTPALDRVSFLPGRELLLHDAVFLICRRKADSDTPAPASIPQPAIP